MIRLRIADCGLRIWDHPGRAKLFNRQPSGANRSAATAPQGAGRRTESIRNRSGPRHEPHGPKTPHGSPIRNPRFLGGRRRSSRCPGWREKSPPCDEPGFLAAQVFAVAAETGWPEERILHMPLARPAQYQHCLLRRNGVRTIWCRADGAGLTLREQLEALRGRWIPADQPL